MLGIIYATLCQYAFYRRHNFQIALSTISGQRRALDNEAYGDRSCRFDCLSHERHVRQLLEHIRIAEARTIHQEHLFIGIERVVTRSACAADGLVAHAKYLSAVVDQLLGRLEITTVILSNTGRSRYHGVRECAFSGAGRPQE